MIESQLGNCFAVIRILYHSALVCTPLIVHKGQEDSEYDMQYTSVQLCLQDNSGTLRASKFVLSGYKTEALEYGVLIAP